MGKYLDLYSLLARAFPIYLVIAPIPLLLAALLPEGLNITLGTASAIVLVPLSYLMGQIGADFGSKIEKQLWSKWRGAPTTRFLRHSNSEFNKVTRNRVHDMLRTIGLHVPSEKEQKIDPDAADQYYRSCTEEIIRRTRDQKLYPLVFKTLVEYGFRRNMLGLKKFGLSLTSVALMLIGWNIFAAWNTTQQFPATSVIAVFIIFGLLLCWMIWINEKAVFLTANRYAHFLLEAALDLK